MLIVHGANASPFVRRMHALRVLGSPLAVGRPSFAKLGEEERALLG
jgi:hypothetical protein